MSLPFLNVLQQGKVSSVCGDPNDLVNDRQEPQRVFKPNGAPLAEGLDRHLHKMRGSPPRVSATEMLWSWLGAFLGIGAVALVGQWFLAGADNLLTIKSGGARTTLATDVAIPID